MSNVQFLIEDNIPIPKREVEFGPRGSQYPIAEMQPGQSFRVPVEGEEGAQYETTDKETGVKTTVTLTAVEDAKKKATQKQSYFSSMGRKLGIRVVTRYFAEDPEYGPHLRVWHDGYRTAEEAEQEEGVQEEEVQLD